LRQAIWRKTDPGWPVHGIPDVLYADHGSDFTSDHLAQVAADLHIELVHSTVGRPQGRGKLERLFGSITTELLPELPGHLVHGKPASAPALTLPQLDVALRQWITTVYHQRPHSETGQPPQRAWIADGWLPRSPDTLEDLDLLLIMVATPRVVHRDGIRFQGLRYLAPTLAAYVGEPVTIRYDPPRPRRGPGLPPQPVPLPGDQPEVLRVGHHAQGHPDRPRRAPPRPARAAPAPAVDRYCLILRTLPQLGR
jgi:putative transposase